MALMALTATLSAVVSSATSSSNKPRIDDKERSNGGRITTRLAAASEDKGRRGLLLSSVLLASQLNDSQAQLLQKYKTKSDENKAKNDKERLDSYYKRNYKDYFGFVEGSLKEKKEELTESEKGILKWLETNK
ncbi:hypothetical protein LguiA_016656 [Lonicera macranthoides]